MTHRRQLWQYFLIVLGPYTTTESGKSFLFLSEFLTARLEALLCEIMFFTLSVNGNEMKVNGVEQVALYSNLGALVVLMINSYEHIPTHEQVAFITLKRMIYAKFVICLYIKK